MCWFVRRRLAGGADGLARLQERSGRYLRQTNILIQIADPLLVELRRDEVNTESGSGRVVGTGLCAYPVATALGTDLIGRY